MASFSGVQCILDVVGVDRRVGVEEKDPEPLMEYRSFGETLFQ